MSEVNRSIRAGWVVIAITGVLLALNGGAAIRDCQNLRPVSEGEQAPDFTIPTIDGSGRLGASFNLADTRGEIIILDFWATWCGPCQDSMPVLEGIARSYKDRGVRVISINTEGAKAAHSARRMANQLAPSVELMSDTGVASALYKVNAIPHMLILDRDGTVRWVHRGLSSTARLRRDLEKAIKELL